MPDKKTENNREDRERLRRLDREVIEETGDLHHGTTLELPEETRKRKLLEKVRKES